MANPTDPNSTLANLTAALTNRPVTITALLAALAGGPIAYTAAVQSTVTAPITGDVSGTLPNLTVNKINGTTPAALATDPRSLNMTYKNSANGAVSITQQAKNAQIVNADDFGAKGDGVTDDEPAIQTASLSFGNAGGTVQLTCGKQYRIKQTLPLGAVTNAGSATNPGVYLQGCNKNPDDPGIVPGMTGAQHNYGGIVRDPSVTIYLARNGGLRNLAITQAGVFVGMDTAASFAGSAISQLGGGAGQTIDIEDVSILGGAICYDGRGGGGRIKMNNVIGDCQTGFIYGASADSSLIGYIHAFPTATAGFSYTVTSVTGNGTTTTVNFTGGTTFPAVGDHVYVLNGPPPINTPPANSVGFPVTASSAGSVSFASSFNGSFTNSGAGLVDVERFLTRTGTGHLIQGQNDDSRFDNLFDLGHQIGIDDECGTHGIHHLGRFWADTNPVLGVKINQCQDVHFNSVQVAGSGGAGMQVTASNFSIDDFKFSSFGTNCLQVDSGNFQAGNVNIQGCQGYGLNIGTGLPIVHIHSLVTGVTPNPVSPIPGPAESVRIDSISTDLPLGANVFAQRTQQTLTPSGSTLSLPATSVPGTGACEEYYVAGSAAVNTIAGAFGGRCIRLIELSTGTIATNSGSDIALAGGTTFGGSAGSEIELSYDVINVGTSAFGGVYREHWRRNGP